MFAPYALENGFIEFKNYDCPFKDCSHTNENECSIKKEAENNDILKIRYGNYLRLMEER